VLGRYTSYTIKILAPGGRMVDRAMNLICTSDHDVKLAARVITRPHGLEIWDGDRLVAAFPSTAGSKAA
jgi:hypothetical protein